MTIQDGKTDSIGRGGKNFAGRIKAERCAILALVSLGTLLGPLGCRQTAPANTPATIIDNNAGPDPAAANMAQAGGYATPGGAGSAGKQSVRVLGAQAQYAPQQNGESLGQQPAYAQQQPAYAQQQPAYAQQPVYGAQQQTYPTQPAYGGQEVPPPPQGSGYDSGYDSGVNAGYDALEEATQAPPPLPEYDQPPAPEPNTIWTPGYWNYANAGYFWVPGAWVAAPYAGALWTPGYWGGYGNGYRFHRGFWARHIGFYGGVNYGYGYTGTGYEGGYWRGNDFFYNRAVNRVNGTNIRNVYVRNITVNNVTRVSYNGGNGGLQARPRAEELAVLHEQRMPPMTTQVQMRQEAAQNRQQFFAENHGRPAVPAAARLVPAVAGFQARPAAGVPPNGRMQPGQTFDRGREGNPPMPQRAGQPIGQPTGQPMGQEQVRAQQDAQARLQQQQRQAQEQARTLQESQQRNRQPEPAQPSRGQDQVRTQPEGQPHLQTQPWPQRTGQATTGQEQVRAQPENQRTAPAQQPQDRFQQRTGSNPPNGSSNVQRSPQQPGESERGGFGPQRGADRQGYQPPRAVQPQAVVPPAASHLQPAPQGVHPQPQPQPGSQPVAPQRIQQPQAIHPPQVQAQPRSQPQAQPQHMERAQPQSQAAPHGNEAKPR